ncbi:hypothetical protein ACFYY8_13385 [Streptosporangium sp. NPDC001559]|uniref:hypothetical protein n=1 Tax=Streptosporangium sp. NPDC001559 TaxID=3366187 RepID=UPI0036E656FD
MRAPSSSLRVTAVAAVTAAGLLTAVGPANAGQTRAPQAPTAVAASDCGGTITHKDTHKPGRHTRTYRITWGNCGSRTSRKKVDIRWARDLPCKTIPGGSTATWTATYPIKAFAPYPRSIKNC